MSQNGKQSFLSVRVILLEGKSQDVLNSEIEAWEREGWAVTDVYEKHAVLARAPEGSSVLRPTRDVTRTFGHAKA